jgi:hypothetical protein
MKKQTKVSIISILGILILAAGVYMLKDKQSSSDQQQVDPNIVEYKDEQNNASLTHHKDWQVNNSYGFTRLTPKMSNGDVQMIQVSYLPTAQRLSELKFGASANKKVQVGTKNLETVTVEIPWKDSKGITEFTTKTDYYLWEINGRKILFEIQPAQNPLSDNAKKVIESLTLK